MSGGGPVLVVKLAPGGGPIPGIIGGGPKPGIAFIFGGELVFRAKS